MADDATTALSRRDAKAPMKYRTIDADQHLNPLQTFWQDYLPSHLRDLAPKIEHADDADYVVFEGRRKKISLISAVGGKDPKDFKMDGRETDVRPASYDAAARLADMDLDGVDAAVMYGGGPLGTPNMELYIESFRAYNRYVKEWCDYDRRRLCPVGYVPMRDVDEAVRFVEELAAMGFTTINIPAYPQNPTNPTARTAQGTQNQSDYMVAQVNSLTGDPTGERQYHQPEFDKLWAALIDHKITATFHLGGRFSRFMDKDFLLVDMVMSKFAMCEPFAIMLYNGVFDRFPELKLAAVEAGSGWMAFAADYMDRTWEKQRYWTGSQIKHTPSYYFDNNIYTSFIHDQIGIANRHFPGAKNIMWSTDYPHSETTWPESQKWIDRLFQGVPEDEKHMILAGRAQKLFRIGE